jgi:hypothetical protein
MESPKAASKERATAASLAAWMDGFWAGEMVRSSVVGSVDAMDVERVAYSAAYLAKPMVGTSDGRTEMMMVDWLDYLSGTSLVAMLATHWEQQLALLRAARMDFETVDELVNWRVVTKELKKVGPMEHALVDK